MATHSVQDLNEADFRQAVSVGLTLVDFWAPWCSPCRMMGPVLQELLERHAGLTVARVNVDEAKVLAAQFHVQAIPLLVLLKDGHELDRFVGLQSASSLTQAIGKHMTGITKPM